MQNMYTGIAPPPDALQPGSRRPDLPTRMLGGAAASQMSPMNWRPPLSQGMPMPPAGYGANPAVQMDGIPPVDLYTGRAMRAPSVAAMPSDMSNPQPLGFAHLTGQFNPGVVGPQRQLGLLDPGYMMPSFSPEQNAMPYQYGLLGG